MGNPSSSKSVDINLNVPLFPNDSPFPKIVEEKNYFNQKYTMYNDTQLPKKEKVENDNDFFEMDDYEHEWQRNSLRYIHSLPDPQPIIKNPTSVNEHCT